MSDNFQNDWLEELKARCSIQQVIGQYVQLSKKGGKWFGCCPFHNEKTGSFCVNEDGQYYHCFGCGVTGDVVKFVMEIESCSFIDACKMLAEKVNFEIPEFKQNPDHVVKKEKKEILEQCMHDAFGYYYKNLRAQDGAEAREYLAKRGISEEVCNRYGLGLSLSYDGVSGYLRRKGYTLENLRECGLIEGDKASDAFFNRIIVPILDSMKRVVAFGGRIYHGEENRAKYKNSTNTAQEDIDIENKYVTSGGIGRTYLFDKSKTVYGLCFAKEEKRNGGLDEIILVEGYMDVISLGSVGITNAVAGMGTALTPGQAKEIVRVCRNVLVCYDDDEAGHKASVRNVGTLAEAGANVKIICLMDGDDPDDYVRKHGAEGYRTLMREALPLVDFKLKLYEQAYGLNSVSARAQYASAAVKVLAEIKDGAERAVYISEVAKKCQLPLEVLAEQVKNGEFTLKTEKASAEVKPSKAAINALLNAEIAVLHFLLANSSFAELNDLDRAWFNDETALKVFDLIADKTEKQEQTYVGMVFGVIEENDTLNKIVNFDLGVNDFKREEQFYTDSALKLANSYLTKVAADCLKAYDTEQNPDEKRKLFLNFNNATQKRNLNTLKGKKLNL